MSWEYQLHMCYAWYSTWAFFVYCGHLGFWGLGRLHIVNCLPEYSSCFWMRIKGIIVFFFIPSSYWGKIRCVPFGEHAVQLHSVMDTVEQTHSESKYDWCFAVRSDDLMCGFIQSFKKPQSFGKENLAQCKSYNERTSSDPWMSICLAHVNSVVSS